MPMLMQADDEEDDAHRQAEHLGRLLEHLGHVGRADEEEEPGQADRQQGDHVAAVALHGGQRIDLADDADPLANREGDLVEDRREVATDLGLDLDGGDHQVEVLGGDAADEVVERRLEGEAQLHLADDALELLADRWPRLAGDELHALEERGAGAKRVREQRDRVGQLVRERLEPAVLAAVEVEARRVEAEDERDDQCAPDSGSPGRRTRAMKATSDEADRRDRPEDEELGRLHLQVRAREVRGQPGREVLALDDARESGDHGGLRVAVLPRRRQDPCRTRTARAATRPRRRRRSWRCRRR